MPKFGPIKRKDLVYYLRELGFEGPFQGARHQIMERNSITVRIPNPHSGDIGRNLLAEILREAGISRSEWEKLK